MAYNPNSLKNLRPGARKGVKQKATKTFIETLVKALELRLPDMLDALDILDPKEKVAAYIKLVDRFMPKPEPEKEDEPQTRDINFNTILYGDEQPQPLLDITDLQSPTLALPEAPALAPNSTEGQEPLDLEF